MTQPTSRHTHHSHGGASLPFLQHKALVKQLVSPLEPVRLPLGTDCLGLALAEPITARIPVPSFTNSAMDGFAVRHSDVAGASVEKPITLPVAGDIPAGDLDVHTLDPGTAWRIMTGAHLPAGADTIIRVEQTDHAPGIRETPRHVTIFNDPGLDACVRHEGSDLAAGDIVLESGRVLDPAGLSAAASVGCTELTVIPRPRVGIITTGTELISIGDTPVPGQVYDSNAVLLASLFHQAGALVVAQDRVSDDPAALLSQLNNWPDIDLLVTAGGISQGAYEVVRQAFSGPTMDFHHVAQQPGGPQGIGTIKLNGRMVPTLCLPGNPVSVFVSFHVYVAGALAILGHTATADSPTPYIFRVTAGEAWSSPAGKTQFIPLRRTGHEHGSWEVSPSHKLASNSFLVASLAKAEGLGIVPAGVDHIDVGDELYFFATRSITPLWTADAFNEDQLGEKEQLI